MKIKILESARKHGLTNEDIEYGIANTVNSTYMQNDKTDQLLRFSFGPLPDGRICEFLSFFEDDLETIVVFHALTPPTENFMKRFRKG